MGYRYNHIPPKPENMLPRFAVRNGATIRIALGCYYLQLHDKRFHDYIGWPSPTHPDHICQVGTDTFRVHHHHHCHGSHPAYTGRYTLTGEEIDLIDEGYQQVQVVFEEPEQASGIQNVVAYIDEDNPFIIYLKMDARFPTFSDKPKDLRFTVFIGNPGEGQVDAVCHAFLTVLPGPNFNSEQEQEQDNG